MSNVMLPRLARLVLAVTAVAGALMAGVSPAGAAEAGAAKAPAAPMIRIGKGVPLKLTKFERIGNGSPATQAAVAAEPTVCIVDSPFGPDVAPGPQIEVAFTMFCVLYYSGTPSPDVTFALQEGEIRRADNTPHSAVYTDTGVNSTGVVAIGVVASGTFKGVTRVYVTYLGLPYSATFETVARAIIV